MPLKNILSKRQSVLDNAGNPLSGGMVVITEPNTSTAVVAYKDSGLVTSHSLTSKTVGLTTRTGVLISGSGRVNIWVNVNCDIRIYNRDLELVTEELNANPASSDTDGSSLIANGSFEIDTDTNGTPDSWTLSSETGSTNATDNSESTDGAQSFRFTSSGSGGGSLTTTDFFAVNDADDLRVRFSLKSTVVDIYNIVRVEWYDISQVFISNSDIYDNVATNPTSWETQNLGASPPSGARFAKLKLIGGDPGAESVVAGSTYFDNVSVYYPVIASGIIDNITIQSTGGVNQIITTDTNGPLKITPNGTGSVDLGNANNPDLTDTLNAVNIGSSTPDASPHLAIGYSVIQAKDDINSAGTFLDIQPLGGVVRIGAQTGAGLVDLYFDGSKTFSTDTYGARLHGSLSNTAASGGNQTTSLQLYNSGGQTIGHLKYDTSPDLGLKNFVYGGRVSLDAVSAAGMTASLILADPDLVGANEGGVQTKYVRITKDDAPLGIGDDTAGLIIGSLGGLNLAITQSGLIARNNGAAADLYVNPIAGAITQIGSSTNGHIQTNDSQVTLFHGDADQTFRTIARAAGGAEAWNDLTGSGYERVLTESDKLGFNSGANTVFQTISVGTATDVTNIVVSPPATGRYQITVYVPFYLDGSVTGISVWFNVVSGTSPKSSIKTVLYESGATAISDTDVLIDTAISAYNAVLASATPVANQMLEITGTIEVTGTLPVVQLQMGTSGGAGNLNIRDGASISLLKVA